MQMAVQLLLQGLCIWVLAVLCSPAALGMASAAAAVAAAAVAVVAVVKAVQQLLLHRKADLLEKAAHMSQAVRMFKQLWLQFWRCAVAAQRNTRALWWG
jgi:hypothetical protein